MCPAPSPVNGYRGETDLTVLDAGEPLACAHQILVPDDVPLDQSARLTLAQTLCAVDSSTGASVCPRQCRDGFRTECRRRHAQ